MRTASIGIAVRLAEPVIRNVINSSPNTAPSEPAQILKTGHAELTTVYQDPTPWGVYLYDL